MINACWIRYYLISYRCHFDTILVLNSILIRYVFYVFYLKDIWFVHVKFDYIHCLLICIRYLHSWNTGWQMHVFSMHYWWLLNAFSIMFNSFSMHIWCLFHLDSIWWCFFLFLDAILCLFDCIIYLDSY